MVKLLRNLFFISLATILCAACVEERNTYPEGIETEVTFSLDVEGNKDTRAISDGKSVDMLVYAIVTEDGELVSRGEMALASKLGESLDMTMTMTLAYGETYRTVFWAQSSKCEAYTFSDDLVLTVDYNGLSNDEDRDAFYGISTPFTVSESSAEAVLKRPFAQLNAGTFPFDWEYATGFHEFDVVKSAVRINDVANTLNLWDGTVSGKVDAVFSPAPLPEEMLLADVDEDGTDEEYVYLAMAYVLADTEPSYHYVDLSFLDKDNGAVMFESPALEKVELQRNLHTDFVGQVLTNSGELNIREYIEAENVYYNISEDTVLSDKMYVMSGHGAVNFASEDGQKFTLDNIFVTGDIWTIELGEYRGKAYVNYVNELNNVEFSNLNCTSAIECHEWYFSPASIAYGYTVLNNCKMTGATTVREPITDKHGVEHEVIPVDIGVRNESDAVFNGGTFGTVFAWTHAVVDIYGSDIDTLYCGTCDSTKHSWMTIHSGTTIDRVICCEPRCPYGGKEYSTTMTIKNGAVIGSLQLVSTDVEFLIIEPGAKVGKITCEGVEYTYEELRSAMGL